MRDSKKRVTLRLFNHDKTFRDIPTNVSYDVYFSLLRIQRLNSLPPDELTAEQQEQFNTILNWVMKAFWDDWGAMNGWMKMHHFAAKFIKANVDFKPYRYYQNPTLITLADQQTNSKLYENYISSVLLQAYLTSTKDCD